MPYCNLSAAAKAARSATLNAALGASARITLYTGTQPASPDVAATGTALVSMTAGSVYGSVVGGALVLTGPLIAVASAGGDAAWARLATSDGHGVVDLDVGTVNASVIINTATISPGLPILIDTITITEG